MVKDNQFRSWALLGMAHGVNHAYLLFFSPFLIFIKQDLGVEMAALGGLVTFAFASHGLGSLPAGAISDVLGYKKSVVAATLAPAAGCLAGFLARGYLGLALGFGLIGLGTSIYHPCGYAFMSRLVSKERRGTAIGIHGVGGNIGMVLAPALTALASAGGAWRRGFLLWAAIGCISSAVLGAMLPELGEGEAKESAEGPKETDGSSKMMTASALIVLAILAAQGFFNDGVFAFLPTFLQIDKGMGVLASGLVSAVTYGGGVFGQLFGGVAADRWGRKACLWAGSAGCLAAFSALPSLSAPLALGPMVLLMGFCLFMLQPAINALVADVTPPGVRGTAYGAVFLAKYGVGAFAPFVGGLVAQARGLGAFMYLLAAVTLGSMALLAAVPETGRTRK